ncbi:unnamed protein product [Ectocarpus fasciculatus]
MSSGQLQQMALPPLGDELGQGLQQHQPHQLEQRAVGMGLAADERDRQLEQTLLENDADADPLAAAHRQRQQRSSLLSPHQQQQQQQQQHGREYQQWPGTSPEGYTQHGDRTRRSEQQQQQQQQQEYRHQPPGGLRNDGQRGLRQQQEYLQQPAPPSQRQEQEQRTAKHGVPEEADWTRGPRSQQQHQESRGGEEAQRMQHQHQQRRRQENELDNSSYVAWQSQTERRQNDVDRQRP